MALDENKTSTGFWSQYTDTAYKYMGLKVAYNLVKASSQHQITNADWK